MNLTPAESTKFEFARDTDVGDVWLSTEGIAYEVMERRLDSVILRPAAKSLEVDILTLAKDWEIG